MSRIGKQPVNIPDGIQVSLTEDQIEVSGTKGKLVQKLVPSVKVEIKDKEDAPGKEIIVSVKNPENKEERSRWGLQRSLINNMVVGLTEGFTKQLEVNGVGYKVALQGQKLVLNAILGLKIYEQLGKINIPFVTQGISKTLENIETRPEDYENPKIKEQIKELKEFAEKNALSKRRGLESKITAGIAIIGFIGSVSFLSPNLTGNVIENLNSSVNNGIGIILLLIGLVGSFFYLKNK